MHNIKDLRTNIDNFKKLIESRNADIDFQQILNLDKDCLLYTSPSPRDLSTSRMPSSA